MSTTEAAVAETSPAPTPTTESQASTAGKGTSPAPVTPPASASPAAASASKASLLGGEQKASATPAAGAFTFKAPEGVEFEPKVLETYGNASRELGLTNEVAQKLLDQIAPALQAQHDTRVADALQQWDRDLRADQEVGSDANIQVAAQFLDRVGTPALRTLLKESGLYVHPEMVRVFYRAGKAISPDTRLVTGAPAPTTPVDPAQRIYPNMEK